MARFDSIPGNRLTETPQNMLGVWGSKISSTKGGIDTLTIIINPNSIAITTSYNYHELQFAKDYVIHALGKYYVIGLNDPNFNLFKNIIILEESKNGFKIYPITESTVKFENREDLEDLFESKHFYGSGEDLPPQTNTSSIDFDNQVAGKIRLQYYKIDESRIEALLNSRFRNKNFLLMSTVKQNIQSPSTKPKSSKK